LAILEVTNELNLASTAGGLFVKQPYVTINELRCISLTEIFTSGNDLKLIEPQNSLSENVSVLARANELFLRSVGFPKTLTEEPGFSRIFQ